ncbi:MAG: hypothetical protein AB2A00_25215 [Myxococcota bacterium]
MAILLLTLSLALASGEGVRSVERAGYERGLAAARVGKDPVALWSALMRMAWFEKSVDEHARAIALSNEALTVATRQRNDFMIGRSLAWLGWSYAHLGLYELAQRCYERAVALGAPDGKVRHVAVWGLATQELGYLHFRMGHTREAKALLGRTVAYAREHRILVGVAEGGAHLAEIALQEGSPSEAWGLAREALRASEECNCSTVNTARARVMLARVAAVLARQDPARHAEAVRLTDEAHAYATQVGSVRSQAEALLVRASLLPPHRHDERLRDVAAAFELLESTGSELRGRAQVELGRVYLEKEHTRLAELYITQGMKVDEGMFRTVDRGHSLLTLAQLRALQSDDTARLVALAEAADAAVAVGNTPVALEAQESLANALAKLGYDRMALGWATDAQGSLQELLKRPQTPEQEQALRRRQIALSELMANLALRVSPGNAPAPP